MSRTHEMSNKPLIVGIGGGTASGKTTMVQSIIEDLNGQDVVVIQHDSYYRDRSQASMEDREATNYDHPDAIETDLLVRHLTELSSGRKVCAPVYDFATHTRKQSTRAVAPGVLIIVEGILTLADAELRKMLDVKVYVDAGDDIRFIRRLQRDTAERHRTVESVIRQYLDTVQPSLLSQANPMLIS